MEDKSIRELFNNFDPELSNDFQFMSRLKSNMDSVELVKKHNLELQRKNRKAVIIAASVGFLFGLLFSMFLPAIGEAVKGIQAGLHPGSFVSLLAANYLPIALTIIVGGSVFISLNIFDLALYLLGRKE
ncbi:MAG: hypothetical protein HDS97_01260 [Bacteroidales bacterium]|nr:hypothetical protein [Bacteroidales bacterium]